jgi:hypothetical protein
MFVEGLSGFLAQIPQPVPACGCSLAAMRRCLLSCLRRLLIPGVPLLAACADVVVESHGGMLLPGMTRSDARKSLAPSSLSSLCWNPWVGRGVEHGIPGCDSPRRKGLVGTETTRASSRRSTKPSTPSHRRRETMRGTAARISHSSGQAAWEALNAHRRPIHQPTFSGATRTVFDSARPGTVRR